MHNGEVKHCERRGFGGLLVFFILRGQLDCTVKCPVVLLQEDTAINFLHLVFDQQ